MITGGFDAEPQPFVPGRRAAPRTAYQHPTYRIGRSMAGSEVKELTIPDPHPNPNASPHPNPYPNSNPGPNPGPNPDPNPHQVKELMYGGGEAQVA